MLRISTEVYDVIRVTRRANKDLGRLVEVEEVGYQFLCRQGIS